MTSTDNVTTDFLKEIERQSTISLILLDCILFFLAIFYSLFLPFFTAVASGVFFMSAIVFSAFLSTGNKYLFEKNFFAYVMGISLLAAFFSMFFSV